MANTMRTNTHLLSALVLGLLFAGLMTRPGVACEINGAQYVLRGHPKFVASFRFDARAASVRNLVFDVHSRDTGRTYSFWINRGNGYGETTLIALKGNISGSIELYTLDEVGEFSDFFGSIEEVAPKNLLLPKLGPALWYDADELSGQDSGGRIAEQMPRAFFDRVACGPVNP